MRRILAALLLTLAAVPAAQAASAPAKGPLVLERWFLGRSHATGTFKAGLFGKDRGVTADFLGTIKGGEFILIEDIAYSDGEKAHKEWHFTKTGEGTYVGLRDDVVGKAIGTTDAQGRIRLVYTAVFGGRNLKFDDILALQPDGTVLNTSTVDYLLFHVGDVELRFTKGKR